MQVDLLRLLRQRKGDDRAKELLQSMLKHTGQYAMQVCSHAHSFSFMPPILVLTSRLLLLDQVCLLGSAFVYMHAVLRLAHSQKTPFSGNQSLFLQEVSKPCSLPQLYSWLSKALCAVRNCHPQAVCLHGQVAPVLQILFDLPDSECIVTRTECTLMGHRVAGTLFLSTSHICFSSMAPSATHPSATHPSLQSLSSASAAASVLFSSVSQPKAAVTLMMPLDTVTTMSDAFIRRHRALVFTLLDKTQVEFAKFTVPEAHSEFQQAVCAQILEFCVHVGAMCMWEQGLARECSSMFRIKSVVDGATRGSCSILPILNFTIFRVPTATFLGSTTFRSLTHVAQAAGRRNRPHT